MEIKKIVNELNISFPDMKIIEDFDMSQVSSYKTGGKSEVSVFPRDSEQISQIIRFLNDRDVNPLVLGGCTNILVSDRGISGVTIFLSGLNNFQINETELKVSAGISSSKLSDIALENQLSGLEFLSGLPGFVGGAAYMNARAFGSEMGNVISTAVVVNKKGDIFTRKCFPSEFSYKSSPFRKEELIVVSLDFNLIRGIKEDIREKMENNRNHRIKNGENMFPSCGCVFKNSSEYSAGRLIDSCQLKGFVMGNIKVSPLHANFIVYEKNATSSEIRSLMSFVRKKVLDDTGFLMDYEVEFVGDWD
ncbi:MAG: UDP-N-acetylmuramate dehydrogenase [Deltaproteobacteria bacterium]|nr:UDP-N-acetylmuramate dehydrogenase [Deltaproteobacteria bacterium]